MRHVRMLGLCLTASIVMSAMVAAGAAASEPTKSKKIFQNCPVHFKTENGKQTFACIYGKTAATEGGYYKVGGITVPLAKPVVLQYGLVLEAGEEQYVPPLNGVEAIAPTPEKVPGEPIAHITPAEQEELGWPETLKRRYQEGQKHHSVKTVYETIELAGIPVTNEGNLINGVETAVEAPVKIKGENKWLSQLGDVCYIGSSEDPIVQHLTSGSTEYDAPAEPPEGWMPLEGKSGIIEIVQNNNEAIISQSVLVDNTYPVPGASCTGPYSGVIEATLDRSFGLPAIAGASETSLRGTLYKGARRWVEQELFG